MRLAYSALQHLGEEAEMEPHGAPFRQAFEVHLRPLVFTLIVTHLVGV